MGGACVMRVMTSQSYGKWRSACCLSSVRALHHNCATVDAYFVTGMNGIRFRRFTGDIWKYKELIAALIKNMKL